MPETAHATLIPLREILTESISAVKKREASALDQLLLALQNRVVIFGCGALGRRAIEKLQELGIQPLALCDNNELLWGTVVQGISVLSVQQAAAQFGSNALFLIAVWNPHHWYVETEQRLESAGAKFIASYAPLFWRFPKDLLPVFLLNGLPSKVYEAKDAVLEAENLWADDDSLQIYRANIRWRALGDPSHLPPRPSENTYFPADIFDLSPNECILDCGAYDGDTLKLALHRYGSEFAAIYPIEGDAVAFEKLRAYAATLPIKIQEKIHPIHCAVGGNRTVVRFTADGSTGLKRNDNEDIDVQCYPLDDISIAQPVTLIKMDIEGDEYDALLGAHNMIARDKPLLAICVYHTQEDIWRIPLLIHSMLPEHSLFLRAYEGDGFQTVVYAVPTNRILPRKTSPGLRPWDRNKMPAALAAISPLREILRESISAVKKREDSALDQLLSANQNRVVLYGCGTLGRRAADLLREIGIKPLAFCDSDPSRWGINVSGIPVLSPSDAATQFGLNSVFFVTIWNDFHWYSDTLAKLLLLGCTSVSSYAPIFWRFGDRFMDLRLLNEPPHRLYQHLDEVFEAEALWADAESLATYRSNIIWRAKGDPSQLPYPAPGKTYFPSDIFKLIPEEVFIDCGAFDGDTIRLVRSLIGSNFKAIHSIEADSISMQKLSSYLATLTVEMTKKIHMLACAVGAERSVLRFSMSGNPNSKVENFGIDVPCIPLDELFAEEPVTLIKMDIEGAEYDALLGAKTIIKRDHPVLAICVYHTQSDIWRIPLLIRSIDPTYSLFLRSYDGDGLQTVVYAVPKDRTLLHGASPVLNNKSAVWTSTK